MSIRTALRLTGIVLSAITALAVGEAIAQSAYPSRTITVIVPMTPGGPPDVISRLVVPQMTGPLGVPIVVENKPGAGGAIGAAQVARSNPDGYILLAATNNALSVIPAIRADAGYGLRDFVSIGAFAVDPGVFVTRADGPWKDLAGFIEHARKNPGKLSYGSAGVGTTTHLAMEAFKQAHNLNIVHVPFKGTQPAKAAVMGGHIEVAAGPVSVMMPQIRSGELLPLATTARTRVRDLPNVPTVSEAGAPQASFNLWVGLYAPASTPPAALNRLRATLSSVLQDPKIAESIEGLGMAVDRTGPDQAIGRLEAEQATVTELAKTLSLKE